MGKVVQKSIGIKKVVSINDDFKTNFLNYRDSFLKKNLKISSKKIISI